VLPRHFGLLLLVPIRLLFARMLGYHFIEGWSLSDTLSVTVITLTTVGYNEVQPLWPAGRMFTTVLLRSAVLTFCYASTGVVRVIIRGRDQCVL
jgi:voltage-gated potassium channel